MHFKNMLGIGFLIIFPTLSGCATTSLNSEKSINRALTLCGLGSNNKAIDALTIALESAQKKASGNFGITANNEIETQITILLKQYKETSDASIKLAAEQLNKTRECAIQQVNMMRSPTKAELVEQCRQDIQNKLSPKGDTYSGIVKNLRPSDNNLIGNRDIVDMIGYFSTGGTSSFYFKAKCDFTGERFNESLAYQKID